MEKEHHSLLTSDIADEAARLFKALGDPTRIKILHLLSQEECSVGHLTEVLDMTQSAVSHQLSTLRNLRLVKFRREGNMIFYSYADDHVITILQQMITHLDCE